MKTENKGPEPPSGGLGKAVSNSQHKARDVDTRPAASKEHWFWLDLVHCFLATYAPSVGTHLQSITTATVSQSLFPLFQLFEQSK